MNRNYLLGKLKKEIADTIKNEPAGTTYFDLLLKKYMDAEDEITKDNMEEYKSVVIEALNSNNINGGEATIMKVITDHDIDYRLSYAKTNEPLNLVIDIYGSAVFYLMLKRDLMKNFENKLIDAKSMERYGYTICNKCKKMVFIDLNSKRYRSLAERWQAEIIDKNICLRIDSHEEDMHGKYLREKLNFKNLKFSKLMIKCKCGNDITIDFPEPTEHIVSPLDYIDKFEKENLHTYEL